MIWIPSTPFCKPEGLIVDSRFLSAANGPIRAEVHRPQEGTPFEGLRNKNLTIRALTPDGLDAPALALLSEGFFGPHTDILGADFFDNETQIESSVDLFAIEFDVYSYTGCIAVEAEVFNMEGDLIGSGGGPMNEPSHYGVVSENGDIAAIRVVCNDLNGELLNNIQMYVGGGGGCYPDCNHDDELNILDFVCFQGAFQKGC